MYQRKFDLLYYTSLTSKECDETSIKQLEWLHSRLVQQKKDEKEVMEKSSDKKSYRISFDRTTRK